MIFIKLNVTHSQTPRAQSRPLATELCLHGLEHVGLPIRVTVWILPCGFRPELRWPRQTVSVWIRLLPLPVVTVALPLKFCISALCGLSGADSGLDFEHLGTPFRDTDAGTAPRGGWEDTAVHGSTHSPRVWWPGDPGPWKLATGRLLSQLPSLHSQVVKVTQYWPGRYSVKVFASKLVTSF